MAALMRESLTRQVYTQLRQRMMSGGFQPGERLKTRDLAAELEVSETPVREALLLLAHDGALESKPGYYFRVRSLSVNDYLEIREIRLLLEPRAAVAALSYVDEPFLAAVHAVHCKLVDAENLDDFPTALQANYEFHFSIYRRSQMPQLTETLERLWLQIGPLLNLLYPFGRPTYANGHQHLKVIDALRAGDPVALKTAFEQDLIEGGEAFVRHLTAIERGQTSSD